MPFLTLRHASGFFMLGGEVTLNIRVIELSYDIAGAGLVLTSAVRWMDEFFLTEAVELNDRRERQRSLLCPLSSFLVSSLPCP